MQRAGLTSTAAGAPSKQSDGRAFPRPDRVKQEFAAAGCRPGDRAHRLRSSVTAPSGATRIRVNRWRWWAPVTPRPRCSRWLGSGGNWSTPERFRLSLRIAPGPPRFEGQTWPHRLVRSRTLGSHPRNWGSNPHGVIGTRGTRLAVSRMCFWEGRRGSGPGSWGPGVLGSWVLSPESRVHVSKRLAGGAKRYPGRSGAAQPRPQPSSESSSNSPAQRAPEPSPGRQAG